MSIFDVAIIGAGVVGSAIARRLSMANLNIALIEGRSDIGSGTSKANTAILHTGFDTLPNSLESRLLAKGYHQLKHYAESSGIAVEETGALLVAWNEEERLKLPPVIEKAKKNGVIDVKPISKDLLYQMEPHLGRGALEALLIPGESIICPFSTPLAFASQAVINGVSLFLNTTIVAVEKETAFIRLKSSSSELLSRWVINVSGLHSDILDQYFGFQRFKITPRKGELIVFDKASRGLVHHILLPVPTEKTKGVLISPTVFGNVLLGPTAENTKDRSDCSTTRVGIDSLLKKGKKILPSLLNEEVTHTYAGLRAASEFQDYQIHFSPEQKYICVGGIRSTGLSASMGIADYVHDFLSSELKLIEKKEFLPIRVPPLGMTQIRPSQNHNLIKGNSDYGRIICHCEQVSLGEIKDAFNSIIPAGTLDGIKRRTRCLMGRCQGFYCMANILELMKGRNTSVHS